MPDDGSGPATKRDVDQAKEEMMEGIRQIETNLLTEFHRYARGQQSRLSDVETSEHAIKLRLAALEERVLELEDRIRRH